MQLAKIAAGLARLDFGEGLVGLDFGGEEGGCGFRSGLFWGGRMKWKAEGPMRDSSLCSGGIGQVWRKICHWLWQVPG
jgi:hypothetical protein